jgi:hypothetical protein
METVDLIQTAMEHRTNVLSKVESFLIGVVENVAMQPKSDQREALASVVGNVIKLLTTMQKAHGDVEFVDAAKLVDEILENEFYSHVYGPRKAPEPEPVDVKTNKVQPKQSNKAPQGKKLREGCSCGHCHEGEPERNVGFAIMGDIGSMPPHVKEELKKQLRRMGISEAEIKAKLGD